MSNPCHGLVYPQYSSHLRACLYYFMPTNMPSIWHCHLSERVLKPLQLIKTLRPSKATWREFCSLQDVCTAYLKISTHRKASRPSPYPHKRLCPRNADLCIEAGVFRQRNENLCLSQSVASAASKGDGDVLQQSRPCRVVMRGHGVFVARHARE
jgi:hypothetical protein